MGYFFKLPYTLISTMVNNKLKATWKYLKYILNHKKFAFIECYKEGLYWRGVVHDMSKFIPSEFFPYAYKFNWPKQRSPKKQRQVNEDFSIAWLHHKNHNKHHWRYWVSDELKREAIEMPEKCMMEMICDWRAMGRNGGESAPDFYKRNKDQIILHENTRKRLEEILF